MAKSFVEQYTSRTGTFAAKAPVDPAAAPAPEKTSVVDKVLEFFGKQPAAPAGPSFAPSLYDQHQTPPAAPPKSFVDQYNEGSGMFSHKPADAPVAAADPNAAKLASMASFLDMTHPIVRSVGEEAATINKKPKGSPFQLQQTTPSFGYDFGAPAKAEPPPKPDITMPTQSQLDNPKVAKAYHEAVIAFNQPKDLMQKLTEAYDSFTEKAGRYAEDIAIGETATAQSLLDFAGAFASDPTISDKGKILGMPYSFSVKIPDGDIGKNVGRVATNAADAIQRWLDRINTPDTLAKDLSQKEADGIVAQAEKLGRKALVIPADEGVDYQYNPSLYDQKPKYNVIVPRPNEFSDQLAQGVGSSAVFFLPGLGVMRASEALATVSPRLAILFGNSASTAIEAMSESGNIYRSDLASGVGETKAKEDATKSFWANAILVGLTNRFGAFNPETSGFIKRVVMSSPIEGVQEAAQQMIQNKLQNKDLLEQTGSSFLIGAIVGGIMGGGVESMTGEAGGTNVIKPHFEGESPNITASAPPEEAKIDATATQEATPTDQTKEGTDVVPGEAVANEAQTTTEAVPGTADHEITTAFLNLPADKQGAVENGIVDGKSVKQISKDTGVPIDVVALRESQIRLAEGIHAPTPSKENLPPLDNGKEPIAPEHAKQQPKGRVLELKPEDLKHQIEIQTQKNIAENPGNAAGMPEIAARNAKKEIIGNVTINNQTYNRPDTHVVRSSLLGIVKAAGGTIDFTVEDQNGAKRLVHTEKGSTMSFKPSALGLVDHNLQEGDVIRATSANLKEKGTTFRAVSQSGGALAFNIKNLGMNSDSKEFLEETDKIVKRSEIAANLAKELGVPVRTGGFKDKALGIFKPWAHVIRLKSKLGNLRIPVLVHESAHYIDYTLLGQPTKTKQGKSWITSKFVSDMIPRAELDPLLQEYGGVPNSKKREAFAEFVRYWVTEPAKAKERGPLFLDVWENKILPEYPEVRDTLLTVREDWKRYQKMPAAAKVISQISFGEKGLSIEKAKEAIVYTWHDTLAKWTDDLYPIRRFTMLARDRGVKLDIENDPYVLARLSRGWVGKANVFLEKGTFDVRFWTEVNGKAEPNFTGKGFSEIIAPAVESHNVEDLAAWLVARRAMELHSREEGAIHSGIDPKVARDAYNEIGKAHPEFEDIARDLDAYQDAVLKYVYHSGLIDRKGYENIKKLNRSYVPFSRVMDDMQKKGLAGRTLVDLSSPVKKIRGSDRDIINPLESIVKNTYILVNSAERNRVGIAMVNLGKQHPELAQMFEDIPDEQTKVASVNVKELLQQLGEPGMADEVGDQIVNIFRPSMIHSDNVLTVMIDGKKKSFHVDPEMYKALHGADIEDVGVIWKMLSYPAKWLRAGATLTPEFILRNPARDLASAFVYSNYGFMPPIDVARGLYGMYTKDNAYWLWRMGGGEQSMLVSMDRTTLAHTYKDLAAEHHLGTVSAVMHHGKKLKNPIELLRFFSEFTEKMTRVAEAKKAIAQGANPLEAAYSSREVTLDFAKMGSKARSVNMIIAFFNASIQGSVRMVNAFKDQPYRTTARTLTGITLPSILLALWNQQEPDWSEIPQWQKNLFWMIKLGDTWYRFPKPFELGILFGSIPERIIESMTSDNPEIWPELRNAVQNGLTPGLLPTSILPIIENVTNYSFFLDRPLVPQSQENLPAFAQYTSYTSETAKTIGGWLNYSPAKVDNLIQGYFAGVGRYAVQGIDAIVGGVKDIPKGKIELPSPAAADIPVLKAFVVRTPSGSSSESVNRFYNQAEAARSAKVYFDQLAKGTDEAKTKQWLADHAGEIAVSPYYEKVRGQLGEIRTLQNYVKDSQQLTPAEKRKKIDDLDKLMTNIAHAAISIPTSALNQ